LLYNIPQTLLMRFPFESQLQWLLIVLSSLLSVPIPYSLMFCTG
jgi:hypothetical protein